MWEKNNFFDGGGCGGAGGNDSGDGRVDGGGSGVGGGRVGGNGGSGTSSGCRWLWLLFIVVDTLFYCNEYIILLC